MAQSLVIVTKKIIVTNGSFIGSRQSWLSRRLEWKLWPKQPKVFDSEEIMSIADVMIPKIK